MHENVFCLNQCYSHRPVPLIFLPVFKLNSVRVASHKSNLTAYMNMKDSDQALLYNLIKAIPIDMKNL